MLQSFTPARRQDSGDAKPAGPIASAGSIPTAPHREPAEAVVSALGSDIARGLSRAEAQQRLDLYGPNRLKSAPETPWWRRLLEQFQNFLVIILLVATVISMVEWLLQDPRETALPYEAIVILAIVVLNALLGYVQESRAEKSVRALMALAAPEATVVRDGERQRVRDRRDRSRRHRAGRGRGQDPGRRPRHRKCKSPGRRGPPDRRERAGGEGDAADRRRRRPRRPPQHAVLEHGRHLWPRPRGGRRDRHGDRGRPHRGSARSRRRRTRRRFSRKSTAPASGSASSCWGFAPSCSRRAC